MTTHRPNSPELRIKNAFIVGETPTGTGTSFTLAHTPVPGTVEVFVNGTRLTESSESGGFSLSGSTITTTESWTPAEGDEIRVNYRKVPGS